MKIITAAEARKLSPSTDRLLLAVDTAIRSAAVSGHAKAEVTQLLPAGWEIGVAAQAKGETVDGAPQRAVDAIDAMKVVLEKAGFRYESKVGGPDGRAFARVFWG